MLTLVMMLFTLALSVLQLLHHLNITDSVLPGLTHLWSAYPIDPDALRRRIHLAALKSDLRDAQQPCWHVERPCWPEDAPSVGVAAAASSSSSSPRAVAGVAGDGGGSLLRDLRALRKWLCAFPALTVLCLLVCSVYATHVARLMRILPKSAEEHFRSLLRVMESSHKEIESKASQTSQHLIGGVRATIDGQESRSLEVVMDILNEMNEGLTMQQWYEQEKLNIMMEDDLRASRATSRYARAACDVNRMMRDLNRFGGKRDRRLSKLHNSKTKAQTSFQKCYALLEDLEDVRGICGGDGNDCDKRFPRVR